MFQASCLTATLLLLLGANLSNADSQWPQSTSGTRLQPDKASAKARSHLIFNAVHSAGRQWGSSLNHNGFSVFPAVIPEGTVLYHGTLQDKAYPEPIWLAFDMEHAENFATSVEKPDRWANGKQDSGSRSQGFGQQLYDAEDTQHPLGGHSPDDDEGDDDEGDDVIYRAYFQTYRANRDVNVLYFDGMSAGKTDMGTLDTQDRLLRGMKENASWFDEVERAFDICDLATQWGYDGFMRMEVGFEVVKCPNATGFDLVTQTRTFVFQDKLDGKSLSAFSWNRAVAQRYDGIASDRVRFDFSSMVSGLFFPVNISSTIPDRPNLFRLGSASDSELSDMSDYVRDVSMEPRRFTVNWQGVVDTIVIRHADRLASMAATSSTERFIQEVEGTTLTYYDAPSGPNDEDQLPGAQSEKNRTAEAIQVCEEHYFLPVVGKQSKWSEQDWLIFTALSSVTHDICSDLFIMRSLMLEASGQHEPDAYRIASKHGQDMEEAVEKSRSILKVLMEDLAWTKWKRIQPCPADQMLLVAMWPFGSEQDYWEPGCRSTEQVPGFGYWKPGFGPPPNASRPINSTTVVQGGYNS